MYSDASNAYCAIHRSAIQRGVAKHAPNLLPIFDFLYGPHAGARAYFFADGPDPVGSCPLPSGVHQGCVLGPLLFSLGLDEMMEAVRGDMANLRVDSTMRGKEVTLTAGAVLTGGEGELRYPAQPTDKFVLDSAPTYAEVEGEERPRELEVTVRVLPNGVEPGVDVVGPLRVRWEHVRHEANVSLIAYLDDLRITDEAYLMRPFQESLRRRGPRIGLYFTKRAKNYIYVPLPFRDTVLNLYPDAVVVADDSPGDDPASQLKLAVEANALMAPENEGRMLITLCGVAKLMGSPLRLVEREPEAAAVSTAWLEKRVETATLKVARLFAHVGLHAVDEVATRGNRVPGYPKP